MAACVIYEKSTRHRMHIYFCSEPLWTSVLEGCVAGFLVSATSKAEARAISREIYMEPRPVQGKDKDGKVKILVFGGTTEGREIADALADLGFEVTVSVATELGRDELKDIADIEVVVGRKSADEIAAMLWTGDYKYCVDATHPYATEVTENIKAACRKLQISYDRLKREEEQVEIPANAVYVNSAREACVYLLGHMAQADTVFITTGAKEAREFADILPEHRYIRVLPTEESQRLCADAGFLADHILTGHGPFSKEENVKALEETGATYLVTKDGGKTGGFPEKMQAAEACDVVPIVIRRPKEEGKTMEQLVRKFSRIMEMME